MEFNFKELTEGYYAEVYGIRRDRVIVERQIYSEEGCVKAWGWNGRGKHVDESYLEGVKDMTAGWTFHFY